MLKPTVQESVPLMIKSPLHSYILHSSPHINPKSSGSSPIQTLLVPTSTYLLGPAVPSTNCSFSPLMGQARPQLGYIFT